MRAPNHASIGANVRDALSLAVWLNPAVALTTNGGTARSIEKGDSYFLLQGDGGLGSGGQNFLIKQSNTNRVVSLNEGLAANTWHHLGATYNAATGEMRIYLNGGVKNIFMAPVAQVDDDALPLYFGADDSGTRWFNGRLDDLAIYNHVLPPYHMIALANGASPANLPPVPQPIITRVTRTGGADPVGPAIMNSALAQNALAYADRVHVWDNFPAPFPELVGAYYVRIANDDRDAANLRLKVALARPATFYLFRDSRLTGAVLAYMNQWMTAYGFQNTGQSIWLDENGDGSANTEF